MHVDVAKLSRKNREYVLNLLLVERPDLLANQAKKRGETSAPPTQSKHLSLAASKASCMLQIFDIASSVRSYTPTPALVCWPVKTTET